MFFLGFLSFLQITFLPGILILKAFEVRKGLIQTLVLAFGLSLIANHLAVFAITALSLPISAVFYALLAVEIALLLRLYSQTWSLNLGAVIANGKTKLSAYASAFNFTADREKAAKFSSFALQIIQLIFIIMAVTSIWWALRVWVSNIDTVFTKWDSIQSWNAWGTQWFSGQFPEQTSRYPQLIPTNFAVTYAFLRGTQIQFFAKGFMPLFNVFILLMMFDLGLETKNTGYFIGLVATRFILKKFLGELISSGYVDVALAFFSLLPVYVLLKAQHTQAQKSKIAYLWLGGILSAGTALTKQNGLLIFAVYPVLAYLLVSREIEGQSFRQQLTLIVKIGLIGLLILLPWYALNEYRLFTGVNEPNVDFLMGARHEGRDLLERFTRAVGLLEKYAYLYPFVLVMLPFIAGTFQWIALTLLLPYSLIWALAFSIFPRNLALALPYLGLITGMSVRRLLEFARKLIDQIHLEKAKLWVIGIAGAVVIIVGGLLIPDEILINRQVEQQKDILLPGINRELYQYFEELGGFEPIMTNYPVRYLPGLENMQIDIGNFKDYAQYVWTIENHPEARLMLVFEGRANPKVLQDIEDKIEAGTYERIFREGNYFLVKIKP